MIDDFDAVLIADDDRPTDEQPERPATRVDDDPYSWRHDFRSYLDDPE